MSTNLPKPDRADEIAAEIVANSLVFTLHTEQVQAFAADLYRRLRGMPAFKRRAFVELCVTFANSYATRIADYETTALIEEYDIEL